MKKILEYTLIFILTISTALVIDGVARNSDALPILMLAACNFSPLTADSKGSADRVVSVGKLVIGLSGTTSILLPVMFLVSLTSEGRFIVLVVETNTPSSFGAMVVTFSVPASSILMFRDRLASSL